MEKVLREWLNEEDSSDNGWFKFEMAADCEEVYCDLTIADCSRSVHLSITWAEDDSKYRKNLEQAKAKMDKLIEGLVSFRNDFDKFHEHFLEEKDKAIKKREEAKNKEK